MRLGHFALSQTVSSLSSSRRFAVKLLALPLGTSLFSQRGNLPTVSGVAESRMGKSIDGFELTMTLEAKMRIWASASTYGLPYVIIGGFRQS